MDSERYSPDTLTLGGDYPAASLDRLNDLLNDAGRPLVHTGRTAGGRQVIAVRDYDAVQAVDVLRAAGAEARADPQYLGGTFQLAGRYWGHGFSWAELTAAPPVEPPKFSETAPPEGLRRPVVALLDTGVQEHSWLESTPDDPFLIHAEQLDSPFGGQVLEIHAGEVAAAGHGTFLAGLIRLAAPSAQVLSLRVMNDEGKVNESTVIGALEWLAGYHDPRERPVDVVCMAFGRAPSDTDPVDPLLKAIMPLAEKGIPLVASAGNDHQSAEIYPAAFDVVTAVGAGFGRYHAEFSNYGPWVDRYRDGVDVLGPMPGGKWAKWSGTSFSAASFAGDLARPHVR
ncbi:S8 family serine peptidase [Actinoplanes bogorensis]|uniref:S8 family serine peptidase n=1 Tax=Paractinoplanes bogorensis TaxID=1610840 RepID=A0ABS5Z0D7_9ACTN|nr:S8 family serine peptidase [Actinoplanes bogorensis]MBU2669160.1 S8 family serine peptidase [Actinoplanes bogorensis]